VVLHLRIFLDEFDALQLTMDLVLRDKAASKEHKQQAEEYKVCVGVSSLQVHLVHEVPSIVVGRSRASLVQMLFSLGRM
jgi:hypothetical protein